MRFGPRRVTDKGGCGEGGAISTGGGRRPFFWRLLLLLLLLVLFAAAARRAATHEFKSQSLGLRASAITLVA